MFCFCEFVEFLFKEEMCTYFKLTVIVSLTEVTFDMWINTSAILITSILVNISGLEV